MPSITRPDGAVIHYAIKGSGNINILLLANGGMRSSIAKWSDSPYNPWTELSSNKAFRLIGMDQRIATMGDLPFEHQISWETFRDDQIALLDHLDIKEDCHVVGSCIGPSYALQLLRDYPERFQKAVLLQPIGLGQYTTEIKSEKWIGLNMNATQHWFGDWADEMQRTGRVQVEGSTSSKPLDSNIMGAFLPSPLERLYQRMFGNERSDFCFSVTRNDVSKIQHPLLVFPGIDHKHPAITAREITELAPNAEIIEEWRRNPNLSEKLKHAAESIEQFLLGKN